MLNRSVRSNSFSHTLSIAISGSVLDASVAFDRGCKWHGGCCWWAVNFLVQVLKEVCLFEREVIGKRLANWMVNGVWCDGTQTRRYIEVPHQSAPRSCSYISHLCTDSASPLYQDRSGYLSVVLVRLRYDKRGNIFTVGREICCFGVCDILLRKLEGKIS